MSSEIRELLQQRELSALFQPIVELDRGRIHGYEGLLRGPSNSPLHAPQPLFSAAAAAGCLTELDTLARLTVARRCRQLDLAGRLFINLHPLSLLDSTLDDLLGTQPEFAPTRVTIELTEQYPLEDFEAVRARIMALRARGYRIALDDLGAGYAGLRLWSEVKPDYVKIDRYFIEGIDRDAGKREFVRAIVDMGRQLDGLVIAEGIETADELSTVRALGIRLGQGYLFARPQLAPPETMPWELLNSSCTSHAPLPRLSETAAGLVTPVPVVAPSVTVLSAAQLFHDAPGLDTLPVVSDGLVCGVLRRAPLLNLLLARYGIELHGRKPVQRVMETGMLQVEASTRLEQLSQQLTSATHPEADFIILRDGRFLGIGRMRDVLRRITDLQIRNSRYANPLTLLPGNVPIHEHLDELLASGAEFVTAYCDVDHFKPFNDHYGYARGDQALLSLAELLSRHVDPRLDFVGHVGGDDFILILRSHDWRLRCEAILRDFAAEVPALYDEAARRVGGIMSLSRAGEAIFFPLLTLSIGCVQPDPARCRSHLDVASLASDAKCEAKRRSGNALFISRRRGPSRPQNQETAAA